MPMKTRFTRFLKMKNLRHKEVFKRATYYYFDCLKERRSKIVGMDNLPFYFP
ncbi:MAG: hypothetical protein ACJATA_001649 [Sphingobacteriales bacterium]|jgi:hypothetical protein